MASFPWQPGLGKPVLERWNQSGFNDVRDDEVAVVSSRLHIAPDR